MQRNVKPLKFCVEYVKIIKAKMLTIYNGNALHKKFKRQNLLKR